MNHILEEVVMPNIRLFPDGFFVPMSKSAEDNTIKVDDIITHFVTEEKPSIMMRQTPRGTFVIVKGSQFVPSSLPLILRNILVAMSELPKQICPYRYSPSEQDTIIQYIIGITDTPLPKTTLPKPVHSTGSATTICDTEDERKTPNLSRSVLPPGGSRR